MDKNRNLEQNAKLHAMLSDISKQVRHCDKEWKPNIWKRLCIASWLREDGEQPIMIPALDGCGIDVIFEKSSKLSIKKMASLIEWVYAYGAENNVAWSEKMPQEYEQYINQG